MSAKQIDWLADDWFASHHAPLITEPFKKWWLSHYGRPSDYPADPEEQHEYWQRCAFAWMGWQAHAASQ